MSAPPFPATTLPVRRSRLLTILAWLVILGSTALTSISFIALLMILVGSPGSSNSDPIGFLTVVVAPPITFVAGIGLLRRANWARLYLAALLLAVLAYNAQQFLRGPLPETHYVSDEGVPTTVLASDACYSIPVVVICIGLLAMLLSRRSRLEFVPSRAPDGPAKRRVETPPGESAPGATASSDDARGWRVGHRGRDGMFYEELHGRAWQRIDISGEMLMGRAHHVIYFASPDAWTNYPEWARDRRDEIIARIKSEFRQPDYEYGETAANAAVAALQTAAPGAASAMHERKTHQPYAMLALAILLGISGFMFWLVSDGVNTGRTFLPSRHSTLQRSVSRIEEPVMFWASIGLYAVVGAGTLGLAAWGVREGSRKPR